jgi:hypothetical protein
MKPYKKKQSAYQRSTPENRERFRDGKGRPLSSVTDLSSTSSLRNAYRKDIETLSAVNHLLGWVSACIVRTLEDKESKHSFAACLYATDAANCVSRVTDIINTIIKERSPRGNAGAPPHVLAHARAVRAAKRVSKNNRKGGAL